MTAYHVTILAIGEIGKCSVLCSCKTAVTVPLADLAKLPQQCPTCGAGYDDNVLAALQGLRQAAEKSQKTGFKIQLHLEQEQPPR